MRKSSIFPATKIAGFSVGQMWGQIGGLLSGIAARQIVVSLSRQLLTLTLSEESAAGRGPTKLYTEQNSNLTLA